MPAPSSSGGGARFASGALLGERYRIVSLLGRGGMGEVYRADDLKLDHPVALKLLPAAFAQDATALARFHREVRVARQVSHPNVCRVFDVGEADGVHFLAMEYIDGEDLATLLRRIGRLPQDKALEIARQSCAGLAAAHDVGLLHRDLKPANIMIDGRGKARLTDFGLASLAGQISADELHAGTPAYMAPEQLEAQEPTVQSDIYSLGLVLYEIFTGRRAFDASSRADLLRQRQRDAITHPSQIVKDLDPLVERVILRCLERLPEKRPSAALQVARALPGGDPLAAALAAGETPSPEMVAAAGDETAIRPATAWALLSGVALTLACILALVPYTTDFGLAPLEKPPEVLRERTREIIKKLGYSERPADSADWFDRNYEFLHHRSLKMPTPQDRKGLATAEPGPLSFWYRQSPQPMVPLRAPAIRSLSNPPLEVSGMVSVRLDSSGHLLAFTAVPPQLDETKGASPPPDWVTLFTEAGLDFGRFTATEPKWLPNVAFDTRAAWEGTGAAQPDFPLHVSAAAFRGKPVYFEVFGPWDRPLRMEKRPRTLAYTISTITFVPVYLLLLAGAFVLARRNVRLGHGDRNGAFRVAAYSFFVAAGSWLLAAHHVADPNEELNRFTLALSLALFNAALVWATYMGLEPYVRKRWPESLIPWSRLLAGRFWDPLVGRDILAGTLGGLLMALSIFVVNALPTWFDFRGETPLFAGADSLLGFRYLVSSLLGGQVGAVLSALAILLLLFVARWLLRKQWAGILLAGVVLLLLGLGGENFLLEFPNALFGVVVPLFLLTRYGILALAISLFWVNWIVALPLTLDVSRWYFPASAFGLALAAAFVVCGFRMTLTGRPAFGRLALEE